MAHAVGGVRGEHVGGQGNDDERDTDHACNRPDRLPAGDGPERLEAAAAGAQFGQEDFAFAAGSSGGHQANLMRGSSHA